MSGEAFFWNMRRDRSVECFLCNHRCIIPEGKRGFCSVRENRGGNLVSLVWGKPISMAVDPIEKKPLFHFFPGERAFSIATTGCNFRCDFCQNFEISQQTSPSLHLDRRNSTVPPREVLRSVREAGASIIAYTYTEPTVYFEYAYDISVAARDEGIKNVFVTNGYMSTEALGMIAPYLDAANVDLKSYRDEFYREYCAARLAPILRNIEYMVNNGIWVELTTLLIPSLNDSTEELEDIAGFIAGLSRDVPWHISRFHPMYRLSHLPRTPADDICRARQIGLDAGLRYVYSGNLRGDEGESTFCASCGSLLIERTGYFVRNNRIDDSKCPSCGSSVAGIGI